MVSLDVPEENKRFAEENQANFPILSDPDKKAAEAYGVMHSSGRFAQRWTFYIDKEGIIRRIDTQVRAAAHGEDMLKVFEELNFPKKNP